MDLRYNCPHCDCKYEVDDEYFGAEVTCTKCGENFVFPIPEGFMPPAEAPEEEIEEFTGVVEPPEEEEIEEFTGVVEPETPPAAGGFKLKTSRPAPKPPTAEEETRLEADAEAQEFREQAFRKKTIDTASAAKLGKVLKRIFQAALLVGLVFFGFWIWKTFLDPAGKVAWNYEEGILIDHFHLLPADGTQLRFFNEDKLTTLNTTDGSVASVEIPGLKQYSRSFAGRAANQLIFAGEKSIAALGPDHKIAWTKHYEHDLYIVEGSGDSILVEYAIKTEEVGPNRGAENYSFITKYQYFVQTLDGATGEVLFQKDLGENGIRRYTLAGNFLITHDMKIAGESWEYSLAIRSLKDFGEVWKIKDLKGLDYGPEIFGDKLIIAVGERFLAYRLATGEKLWEFECDAIPVFRDEDDPAAPVFAISKEGQLVSLDLAAGKELWRRNLPEGAGSGVSLDQGKLFLAAYGTKEIKRGGKSVEMKLPPAYEKLKREDPTINAMLTKNETPTEKASRRIYCLRASDGRELWSVECDKGELVVGGGRVLVVLDTARSGSMFSMLNQSNKGDTMIRQFDADTGKELYVRKDPVGVCAPYAVVGKKFVAMVYSRPSGVPQRSSEGLGGFGGGGSTTYIGVVGLNIK